ncbi:tripartite motif-containing protein 59 [Spea bombifrons]|uniref:tripartite motif-containing protein 59 n=1 Tax=Spea bombifrons TaxID=233779 RepID=UPI0023499357|nr:tripartite motif-containing protein 59 [Spea bombifrons]
MLAQCAGAALPVPSTPGCLLIYQSTGYAKYQQIMDHFEEELTCSVCFNIFDDPRILPCSHTFCRSCLENVINSLDSFVFRLSIVRLKCPSCRNITELSPGGVNALPINFALKSIVEKYKMEDRHNVATCPEHHKQPLNVFCLKDRKLVCGQCLTVGQHRGHPIDDLQSAYLKERETAPQLLAVLSDKNFTGVSTIIKALEEQMAYCRSIIQTDKQEVLSFFEKTSEMLEQKKQDLLAALNDANQQVADVYGSLIEEMKQIEDEQLDLVSLCSSTEEEPSPLAFLENIHNIRQRMKVLKKQQLISRQPAEIYPRVGHMLTNEYLKTTLGDIGMIPTPKVNIRFKKDTASPRRSSIAPMCFLLIVICGLLILTFCNVAFLRDGYFSGKMQRLVDSFCDSMYNVPPAYRSITRAIQDMLC